jgi:hypothetical protein
LGGDYNGSHLQGMRWCDASHTSHPGGHSFMLVKSTIWILLVLEAPNACYCFRILWQVATLSQSPMTSSAFMITYFNHHGFDKLAKVVLFKSLVV